MSCFFFFFQAEDGIRDAQESRGLGDVYKRQVQAADRTCSEIRRLLAPGGVFVQVSFMQPHFRTKYLDRSADPAVSHTLGEPYGWDVEVQRLDAGLGYFMYTMRL
eukprot:TRINITY_DN5253_c0_g2_i4.p1 TRINITY_DN5253_c0_g2~~TRINITY_DN5253_c0_g2_i4.p1  ORF type:complete len:105 (-),score=31.13 TRINITY_DN5253_c0_g2_i4:404-718(-)